jgi:hypothetical protein
MVGATKQEDFSDPIITNFVKEDKVIWYKKRNLRNLYFVLFPACMGVEMTSGFDSQIINVVQMVPSWRKCKFECFSGDELG